MYCSRCGEEIPEGAKFCSACGECVVSRDELESERKDPSTCALYSLFVFGGGQMHIGDMRRGIMFLACGVVLTILLVLSILSASEQDFWELSMMVLLAALLFAAWIVNIFDAYNQARLYNVHLKDTGRPPDFSRHRRS